MTPAERAGRAAGAFTAGQIAILKLAIDPRYSRPTRVGRARATGRPAPRRRAVGALPRWCRHRRLTMAGSILAALTMASMAAQIGQAMATPIRVARGAP